MLRIPVSRQTTHFQARWRRVSRTEFLATLWIKWRRRGKQVRERKGVRALPPAGAGCLRPRERECGSALLWSCAVRVPNCCATQHERVLLCSLRRPLGGSALVRDEVLSRRRCCFVVAQCSLRIDVLQPSLRV